MTYTLLKQWWQDWQSLCEADKLEPGREPDNKAKERSETLSSGR